MGKKRKRRRTHTQNWFQRNGKFLLIGVVGLMAVGLAAAALTPSPQAAPRTAQVSDYETEPAPVISKVAFLGDSYTAGTGTDNATKSFAAVAARNLGWQAQQFALGGSGYSGPGVEGSYIGRLEPLIASNPSIVVVAGSRNDGGKTAAEMQALAETLYARIHEALPEAKLVVVGPMWTSTDVPASITTLNEGIRAATVTSNATFIDALNPSWLDGAAGTIATDGVHPTEAGHRILAEKFVAAVRAAGLVE